MFNSRERHYAVADLAANWNLSTDLIRDLFSDEPGVIKISRQTSSHKRTQRETKSRPRIWVQLRIPESVAKRVYDRLTRGGR